MCELWPGDFRVVDQVTVYRLPTCGRVLLSLHKQVDTIFGQFFRAW